MQQNNHLDIEQRWEYYREPAILAASGGAIDTISFITLFGLFTAHVTGNLVVAGAALGDNIDGIFTKLAAIPVFMLSVAIATLIIQSRKNYTPGLLASILCAEMLLLALFAVSGYLSSPFQEQGISMSLSLACSALWLWGYVTPPVVCYCPRPVLAQ